MGVVELIVGFVLGLLATGIKGWWDAAKRTKALKAALAAEIRALLLISRQGNYEEDLREAAEVVRSVNHTYRFTVEAPPAFLAVFDSNAGHIGDLDADVSAEVVYFYQSVRGWMLSASEQMSPQVRQDNVEEVASNYLMLADQLVHLHAFGTDLADRLAGDDTAALVARIEQKLTNRTSGG